MNTYLVLASGTDAVNPPATAVIRATQLGCELLIGDPTGQVTAYPCVVVMSSATASQIIPDDTGQATLAEIQTAQTNATNAETIVTNEVAQHTQNIQNLLSGLSTQVTQAQSDLTTLAASTDPLAPILTRAIEAILALTQGLESIGVLGGHVDPTKAPKI